MLKRAAVCWKSLEGRYDPAPHTVHWDSSERVNKQRGLKSRRATYFWTTHPSCLSAKMLHHSPLTHLLTPTLCTFPCRSVIQEAFYSPTFIYPSALSVSVPSLGPRCHCLSQELPLFQPLLVAPQPPNIWHCCVNSFQMPEGLLLTIKLLIQTILFTPLFYT